MYRCYVLGTREGDFAAGSMHAAMGISMALFERERSGLGQVIDAAVLDGAAYLSSFLWRLAGTGTWHTRSIFFTGKIKQA